MLVGRRDPIVAATVLGEDRAALGLHASHEEPAAFARDEGAIDGRHARSKMSCTPYRYHCIPQ